MCFHPARNPGDVLETFNFLENADDSDEDEDEEGDMMEDISDREKHRIKKHKIKVNKPPRPQTPLEVTRVVQQWIALRNRKAAKGLDQAFMFGASIIN